MPIEPKLSDATDLGRLWSAPADHERAQRDARDRGWVQGLLTVLATAAILCLFPIANGQPFYYPDSPVYLRIAQRGFEFITAQGKFANSHAPASSSEASVASSRQSNGAPHAQTSEGKDYVDDGKLEPAGRSVYYGALLLGKFAGEPWLPIVVQALAIAYLLRLTLVQLWGLRERHVLVAAALLSVLTPLGVFTGFLMPDVFASIAIVTAAVLLVYWQSLSIQQRLLVSGLLAFALISHPSHLALAVLLLVAVVLARVLSGCWQGMSRYGAIALAGSVIVALAGEWAFSRAVTYSIGEPPIRLPHLTARLIDLGPGTEHLQRECPRTNHAACAFISNYPTYWNDFLFSPDPRRGAFALADEATKRAISEEQVGLFVAVLKHDPLGVVTGIAADIARQLARFRVDVLRDANGAAWFLGKVPDEVLSRMQRSEAYRYAPMISHASYASVIGSLLLAIGVWWRGRRTGASTMPRSFLLFAWIVAAGVVANAIVCATAAAPLDRFQARVVWLVPFLALAWLFMARSRQHGMAARHSTPAPDRS